MRGKQTLPIFNPSSVQISSYFQGKCVGTSTCFWYTYSASAGDCTLFSECQGFSDQNCADCVSGQPACIFAADANAGTTTTTTTSSYPPECEYTGQTFPSLDSCREYYECLADGTWKVFNCCPDVYDPAQEACIPDDAAGDLCSDNDEGCGQ